MFMHRTILPRLVRFGFQQACESQLPRVAAGCRTVSLWDSIVGQPENDKRPEITAPTPTWPAEAVELYNQLNQLTEDKTWVKIRRYSSEGQEKRGMMEVEGEKMFRGAMFINHVQKIIKAVVIFGPWLEGQPNHVHGGAIAAVHDSSVGIASHALVGASVTANLNTNFKNGIPLGTTALVTSKVDEVDGRKVFISSTITSPDEETVYSDATALFILIRPVHLDTLRHQ